VSDVAHARRILSLIRAYQSGSAPHAWQRELACRFEALPVYADLGGALLLRPDGEILVVAWEDEEKAVPADQRWTGLGRAAAAEFFPELRTVLPPRPAAAAACEACRGAGLERWWIGASKGVTFCGRCFGLGWTSPAAAVDHDEEGK
jgi:hypothetical protein